MRREHCQRLDVKLLEITYERDAVYRCVKMLQIDGLALRIGQQVEAVAELGEFGRVIDAVIAEAVVVTRDKEDMGLWGGGKQVLQCGCRRMQSAPADTVRIEQIARDKDDITGALGCNL